MLGVRPTFHARSPSKPTNSLRLSRAQKQLVLVLSLFSVVLLVWYTSSLHAHGPLPPTAANAMEAALPGIYKTSTSGSLSVKQSDRVTLVVVWSGLAVPKYLNLFLRSVEANSKEVDLLFVAKREQKKDGQCVDLGPVGSNVQVVCLSNLEYWSLHRDYLCDFWKCSPDESFDVFQELVARGTEDYIHSHFRILRGPVFKRYFKDNTRWWGWCDTDVVLGNFKRMVPWDHIKDFDLVQPTHTTSAKEILLYMRGHMTFFNNRQETLNKLHSFPAFQSRLDWLEGKKPISAMEEEDFSTHLFYDNPSVTFFAFDAMLGGHFKTISLSPQLSVFSSAAPLNPSFGLPTLPTHQTLFSDTPAAEGPIELDLGKTKEDTWMPIEKVVSFKTLLPGGEFRRFQWRDQAGVVRERVEEWGVYDLPGGVEKGREGLYVHLQMEKKEKWFKTLPAEPLAKGRVMMLGGWEYAEIWKVAGRKLERVWRGER